MTPGVNFTEVNATWGTWVAQVVRCPALPQVMISQFMSSSPMLSSAADSSEPVACFGFRVSLSLCPSNTCALSLSVSQK